MEIVQTIDHTLLKPETTTEDVRRLCQEAIEASFKAVCVPPYYVQEATQQLQGAPTKVATVIGFPLGYSATAAKVEEIKRAIDEGADEFDVVINISAVKSGNWNFVHNDIDRMTTACHIRGKIIKIIFETAALTQQEIIRLCDICTEINVDYVKTSTGYQGGATPEVVRLLREHLPSSIKIKASGGIRSLEDAQELLTAGAERLGTSAGLSIVGKIA